MKRKIGLAILIVIALMIWSATKEPGISDLEVSFQELNFVRNENNTGPVIRRYLVSISDTIWTDLERYGDLMPYSKLGTTQVYFFLEGTEMPDQLQLEGSPFDSKNMSAIAAIYEKNSMGRVSLKKY